MQIVFEENEVFDQRFLGREGSLIALVDKGILTVSKNYFANIGYLSDDLIALPRVKEQTSSHNFLFAKSVFLKRQDYGILQIRSESLGQDIFH